MSTEKKSMMDKILEKVDVIAGPMTKFGQIPFVRGIVNGMVAALPVTMVGSLFLVVYLFCSDGGLTTHALIPFLKPWAGDLALVNSLSMGIMAVYIIIAFGAEYAEIKGFSKTTGAVGAFFAFMLLNYNSVGQLVVTAKDGTLSAGASAFESTYWGGSGLITAMIAGAIAINIIDICYKKHIVIKLPDSVPPAISDSFSAIIPYFFITLVCWGIRTLAGLNIPELVGQMLLPVLGAADNIFIYNNSYQHYYGFVVYMVTISLVLLLTYLQINGLLITTLLSWQVQQLKIYHMFGHQTYVVYLNGFHLVGQS